MKLKRWRAQTDQYVIFICGSWLGPPGGQRRLAFDRGFLRPGTGTGAAAIGRVSGRAIAPAGVRLAEPDSLTSLGRLAPK